MKKLLIISALLVPCSLSLAPVVASAWSGPQLPPPACVAGAPGCDAPINVSTNIQTKQGPVIVNGATPTGSNAFGILTPQVVVGSDFCFIRNGTVDYNHCITQGGLAGVGTFVNGIVAGSNINISSTGVNGSGIVTISSTGGSPVIINNLQGCHILNDHQIECNGTTVNVGGGGGISNLIQGSGIIFNPNPIITTGTISADPSFIRDTVRTQCNSGQAVSNLTATGATCVDLANPPTPSSVTGSGTANFLTKWNGDTSLTKTRILESATQLTVGGDSNGAYDKIMLVSDNLNIFAGDPGIGKILTSTNAAGNVAWKSISELNLGGFWEKIGTTENIKNSNNGLVGIGTDAPGAKLDVRGTQAGGRTIQGVAEGAQGIGVVGGAYLNGGIGGLFWGGTGDTARALVANGTTEVAGGKLILSLQTTRAQDGNTPDVTRGGTIQINGGNPAENKILASTDDQGNAVWKTVPEADPTICRLISASRIRCGTEEFDLTRTNSTTIIDDTSCDPIQLTGNWNPASPNMVLPRGNWNVVVRIPDVPSRDMRYPNHYGFAIKFNFNSSLVYYKAHDFEPQGWVCSQSFVNSMPETGRPGEGLVCTKANISSGTHNISGSIGWLGYNPMTVTPAEGTWSAQRLANSCGNTPASSSPAPTGISLCRPLADVRGTRCLNSGSCPAGYMQAGIPGTAAGGMTECVKQ